MGLDIFTNGCETQEGSFNGLDFGADTNFLVWNTTGLQDLPSVRSSIMPRGNAQGSSSGLDFYDERIVTMQFLLVCADETEWRARVNEFLDAMNDLDFHTLKVFENDWQMEARCTKAKVPTDYPNNLFAFAEFEVPDPRLYSSILKTKVTTLRTPAGGFTFPLTFPLIFGSIATGGDIILDNEGSYSTYPIAVLTGPLVTPKISDITHGRYVSFDVELLPGEQLTIDFANSSAIFNSAQVRGIVTPGSAPLADFVLPPGETEFLFTAASYNPDASLQMTWRDARI